MGISFKGDSNIPWDRPEGCPAGFEPVEVVVGFSNVGGMALEIAITKWSKKEPPTREALNRLHTIRTNKRATPVVLIVEFDSGGTLVFGPNNSAAPVGPLPVEQTQRIVQAALDESSVIEARKRLASLVQSVDSTSMPGVSNSGLFANHELKVGVPKRTDWDEACKASNALLPLKGKELIEKLGYQTGQFGAHALLLTGAGPKAEALAVLLNDREAFDADSPRFTVSPVAYGLNMADKQGVPWLILVRGNQIRLYSSRNDIGVGRKGLAETFFEVDLPQLTTANSGYLQLIFSAKALAEGGTTYEILKSSSQYAVALGERLRDKVYDDIIPELSVSVADALIEKGYEMDPAGLDLAYQLTLRVFFRMLFQVYAEDRKLLPYGENNKYDRNAIKTVAKDLAEKPDQIFDENSSTYWDDLAQVWRVIDSGDKAWGVPAYNGGLFASDSEISEHGAILSDVHIKNDVMGPVLKALLLDETEDGSIGPVDFRSLSVREFGTIYEGLLESSLGLAEVDLTLDEDGTWIPAKKKDEIYAYAGQVYFHNTSGQRKGTGSYFTPSFVVEHLLERSLDPALDSHLAKVAELMRNGDHAGAAEKFFDFRVADLAMGSGHFLTSAIDHIEQKMAAFLAEDGQSIPGVAAELIKLENAAKEALGEDTVDLERSSLLRRQIARRCIYGLDINPIAVELARVSIWIHTFVRGLPMSSLDHNLVCANSLTGIGDTEEALNVLSPGRSYGQASMYDDFVLKALQNARNGLLDASLLAEVNKEEARATSRAAKKALKEAEKAKLIFDAAVLLRIGQGSLMNGGDAEQIAKHASMPLAQNEIASLKPAHMPVLFPEVFLRENGGFDVLVGNPPWEKIKVEVSRWWALRFPGLRSLPQGEQDKLIVKYRKIRSDLAEEYETEVSDKAMQRKAIVSGPYPGIGKGDPDLYQAFAWRNWQLLRQGGVFGIVTPRSLVSEAGGEQWRNEVFDHGEFTDVSLLLNSARWVFDMEPRYTIAVLSVTKTEREGRQVLLRGPYASRDEFDSGLKKAAASFPANEFRKWGTGAAFPSLASYEDGIVYQQMKKSPRLDAKRSDWRARPYAEFHASADKHLFELDTVSAGYWKLYKGESFNLWTPDTGKYYGGVDPEVITPMLQEKRMKTSRQSNSPFNEFKVGEIAKIDTLPILNPRIAIRLVSSSTNQRTFIAALIPPDTALTHGAPYLLFPKGGPPEEAFVLGVISSLPLDWVARRTAEINITYHVINGLPIPDITDVDDRKAKIIQNAGRLAAVDKRYAKWAKAVGVQVGSVKSETEKEALIDELDALVANLYGLTRSQLEHVFKTFHRNWDYSSRLEQVLAFYDQLPKVKS
jgi:hypothetical protein